MRVVGARHDPNAKAETKLARVRMARGVTQDELAEAIGISVPTYRRLELNTLPNPGLRYLINAALALGVELDEVLDDEWLAWKTFDANRPGPPAPDEFWRRPHGPGKDELAALLRRQSER